MQGATLMDGEFLRKIPLTQGKTAIVDDEDYQRITNYPHPWRAEKNRNAFYAASIDENGSTIRMHKIIANPPFGMEIHHLNANGLDNRKANLELITRSDHRRKYGNNSYRGYSERLCQPHGRRKRVYKTSRYKGVSWQEDIQGWVIFVCGEGTRKYIGYEKNELTAAIKYDKAALQILGKSAVLNIMNNPYENAGR